jgi:hypothetical protein
MDRQSHTQIAPRKDERRDLCGVSASERVDRVAERSDRALCDRTHDQDRFLEAGRRECCKSAGDVAGGSCERRYVIGVRSILPAAFEGDEHRGCANDVGRYASGISDELTDPLVLLWNRPSAEVA